MSKKKYKMFKYMLTLLIALTGCTSSISNVQEVSQVSHHYREKKMEFDKFSLWLIELKLEPTIQDAFTDAEWVERTYKDIDSAERIWASAYTWDHNKKFKGQRFFAHGSGAPMKYIISFIHGRTVVKVNGIKNVPAVTPRLNRIAKELQILASKQ